MIALYKKYKEQILYLFFGGLTTIINVVMFELLFRVIGVATIASVPPWIVSVLFAYITNKLFVFESKSTEKSTWIKEMSLFFAARILSFIIGDLLLMGVFVDYLGSNSLLMKIIAQIFVIVFNYIASKLLIFKK